MAHPATTLSRLLIAFCLLARPALNAQNRKSAVDAVGSVEKVTATQTPHGISLEIQLSADFVPNGVMLVNPDRLVFDFPGFSLQGSGKRIAANSGSITDVRVAQFSTNPPVTRIVVDSRQPLNFEVIPETKRIVIAIAPGNDLPLHVDPAASPLRPSASVEKEILPRSALKKESEPIATTQPSTISPQPAPSANALSSPSKLSAYMLRAKAKDLKLEDLQSLEDKAQAGDAEAETTLALAYHSGTLLKKDDAEAQRWLHRAADQGFMAAEESLGIFAETGVGRSSPAADEAIAWYKKAIQQGSVDAATSIGLIYADGIGMPKNPPQAAVWFRQAAEGGDGVAQYNLALMYKRGDGVAQDQKEYVRWLTAAAEQNIIPALLDLAGYYAEPPDGSTADIGRATRYFEKAGELGNARAQAVLGNIFAMGLQGKPDYKQAVKWYRMAADQGQPDGEFGLGVRYAFGQGVPRDLPEASRLFTAAAGQGQINAQYDLATMYEEANGIPADRSLATHYFELAAEQGMPKAQFRLGRLLAANKDSSRDQIAAYKWLMLAQDSVRESSALLNDLRKTMSAQEIAEAERGVDSWRIAHR